eukprot:bmy_15827T0
MASSLAKPEDLEAMQLGLVTEECYFLSAGPALGSHVNSLIPGLTAKGKIVKGTDTAAEIQQQMRLAPQTPSYSGLAVTFGATIFEHKGQRYRHSTLQVLLLNPFLWGSSPQAWQAKWMLKRQMLFLKPLISKKLVKGSAEKNKMRLQRFQRWAPAGREWGGPDSRSLLSS